MKLLTVKQRTLLCCALDFCVKLWTGVCALIPGRTQENRRRQRAPPYAQFGESMRADDLLISTRHGHFANTAEAQLYLSA